MTFHSLTMVGKVAFLLIILFLPNWAQNVRVEVGRRATVIPKLCEQVEPAELAGEIDVAALVKEARCKGAGDMLIEYTYLMTATRRQKDNRGQVKEETTTYEVYFPTLKSGARARGILLATSHNGVAVRPEELEKERRRAGEQLEKEEAKSARQSGPAAEANAAPVTGMMPVGMYPRMGINRDLFGVRRGGATLNVHTLLASCELTLLRREEVAGRPTLVFSFTPRAGAQFGENEQYVARLVGALWIDVQDRIVTRLSGWPASVPGARTADAALLASGTAPAIYAEMVRLPEGIWLPRTVRINGADYPLLFDHVANDAHFTYSEYKRFATEAKDVKLEAPKDKP